MDFTPPLMSVSTPSANGKNASDAATSARLPLRALPTAMTAESTRDICPAPTPSVPVSSPMTIALDLTCLHTRQSRSSACHSRSVGCALVTTRPPRMSSAQLSGSCDSTPNTVVLSIRFQ